MKRKIAVLANGWNHLGIASALKGIRTATDKLNIDVFLFLSFAAFAQSEERNQGEDAIFDLTDYSEFDGVIIFSGMLNSQKTPERIAKVIVKNNIPGVSVGWPLEGLDGRPSCKGASCQESCFSCRLRRSSRFKRKN